MSEYISDQEQLQVIKNWWRENGKFTILMVICAVIFSYGIRSWQQYKIQKSESASIVYEQMLSDIANHRGPQFEAHAGNLMQDYATTPYASIAALSWAKAAVEKNSYDTAIEKLQWVVEHGKGNDLKQIARIREARILLMQKKYQPALDILNVVVDSSYLPLIDQVRGDIYIAMGKSSEAKSAYQQALNTLPKNEVDRSLLKMKFDNV